MVQPPSVAVAEVDEERAVALRPKLTDAAIKAITYDLQMAQKLVMEALEEGVDYGQIPGVPGKGLWDPGASTIMNAFETRPRHNVLYHEENDKLISWALEAEIIHRASGVVVGAGVGACSTREPKYKYRWVEKAEAHRLGYADPEIENMKTKKGKRWTDAGQVYQVDEYRVENPEYGEQVNTIFKMAAKRAEVDAAQTLPGVASALRKLFDVGKRQSGQARRTATGGKRQTEPIDEDSPRWTTFWNQMKDILGDDYQNKAHNICNVKSMGDWLKAGKSLDDAARFIIEQVNEKKTMRASTSIQAKDVPDGVALEAVMLDCYGWAPERVWSEANYDSRENFKNAGVETAWAVFIRLRDIAKQLSLTE